MAEPRGFNVETGENYDPCGETYWCLRHIFLNCVSVLIFLLNLSLIIVLRISPRCRKRVSFSILFHCYSY